MRGDDLDKSYEKSTSWQGFKFFCSDSSGELNQDSNVLNVSESDEIVPLSELTAYFQTRHKWFNQFTYD